MKFFKFVSVVLGLIFSMETLANPKFSNDLLRKAENGDVLAQYNLGWVYQNSQDVIQNYEKAFEWYSKAANQGNAQAQYNLGSLYQNGQGVEKDDKKAFEWYRKAASNGHSQAKLVLSGL
ncbi:tetratricopeptide repeat protein [Acinetobacter modestus]|uniref:Sel1 repeat family protein n=1 Tax=Acinetobacter modestus TaxID=1776740 RepID=A0ABN0JR70_9GAMM|nr:tetratricopeptide repeat protein [Acinetobacter modestus]ENU27824.1 hypothetical protein F992_00652 [Acinetobacter modestus]GGA20430.1 hypothetical protein GCM10017554_16720 [Acinetobacter modestus]